VQIGRVAAEVTRAGPAGEAHEFGRSCERREMAMDIDVLLFETASAVIVAVVLLAIFRHI
jgi:hypothetical protein